MNGARRPLISLELRHERQIFLDLDLIRRRGTAGVCTGPLDVIRLGIGASGI